MGLRVEIDAHSGFCGGVIQAIRKAETYLDHEGRTLLSLGPIVHNEAELERLKAKGLATIDKTDFPNIKEGTDVLIRAHGEPPETYGSARRFGLNLIDCTCPVVVKLQKSIKEAYSRIKSDGRDGQIIIFGKVGHAEVLGLVGQAGGDALVVENMAMLQEAFSKGLVNLYGPVEIFSQTTKSPAEYDSICTALRTEMAKAAEMSILLFKESGRLTVHNTICSQVAFRHKELTDFALDHDILVFVSGKDSSNGRVLFNLCKSLNIRSYQVSSANEVRPEWFRSDDLVGVCGATSTPKWLLEDVAGRIQNL